MVHSAGDVTPVCPLIAVNSGVRLLNISLIRFGCLLDSELVFQTVYCKCQTTDCLSILLY